MKMTSMKRPAKKMCMANGGVYPQERPRQPEPEPEWKKSMRAAWEAISGNKEEPQDDKMPTIAGTAAAIVKRKADTRAAADYARGGVISVKGAGTSTSDSIPVVVAGQSIGLSNKEGLATLPAKTMQTPGAIDAIESIIQATNDGKPPVPTKAGGRAQGGVTPEDELARKAATTGDAGKITRDGNSFSMAPTALSAAAAPSVPAPASGQQTTAPNQYPYTGQPSPTAQQVYQGVGAGIGDLAAQAFPSTMGAIQRHGDAAQKTASEGNYGGALGHVARGGVAGAAGLVDDTMRSAAYVLDPAANALKSLVTGDNTPARKPEPAGIAAGLPKTPVYSAAADDKMGVPNYPVPQADPTIARNTGNAGDAKHNPDAGMLSFTDPNFDVSQQQNSAKFADGRSIVLTGQGIAGGLPAAGGNVDANGNNMALTQQYQRQLDNTRAENAALAASRAVPAGKSYAEQQRADADRFTQFVNESNTARLAHDLGTGGGNWKTEAGKIAALNRSQARDAAVRADQTAQANADALARNRIDVAGVEGQNKLAGIAALGNNQFDIEAMRQNSPAARATTSAAELKQQLTRGAITDADQARNARTALAAAYETGDPNKIAKAKAVAIAHGILKPDPLHSYDVKTGQYGGATVLNNQTGEGLMLSQDGSQTRFSAPGAAAQGLPDVGSRKVGQVYPTPQGPARWTEKGWELVAAA